MDTETAIDTKIAPQLIEAFGRQVANALLTQATLCYVTVKDEEKKRYNAFVHSICSDERVITAWGKSRTAERKEEWKALVNL
jgi:hypothetical protein